MKSRSPFLVQKMVAAAGAAGQRTNSARVGAGSAIVMKYSCSWCGKIHEKNFDCGRKPKRDYSSYRRKAEEAGRYTYAFKEKSKEIKRNSMNLCAVCLDQGILQYDELETHHIIKLVDAPEKVCDDDNLICLCKRHHRMADRGQLREEYLSELARGRDTPQGGEVIFL